MGRGLPGPSMAPMSSPQPSGSALALPWAGSVQSSSFGAGVGTCLGAGDPSAVRPIPHTASSSALLFQLEQVLSKKLEDVEGNLPASP